MNDAENLSKLLGHLKPERFHAFMAEEFGLVMPELGGLDTAYVDNRLTFHYVPTLMEWLVLLFIATAGIGALFAGTKLLPLTRGHESEASR